jgi:ribosomal protein S18 acetylase RimI-like enzyme
MSRAVTIKIAGQTAISAVKALADCHRDELGFHSCKSFEDSAARGELLVARDKGRVCGFVRFHIRRDKVATIYEVATDTAVRCRGIGRALLDAVIEECKAKDARLLRLSCPADLSANQFYEALGFSRASLYSAPGKHRPLVEWQLALVPHRPVTFVAALSNAANDLRHLIRLWENEGLSGRPFDRAIITPLFSDSRTLTHVRYMHDRWGVEVVFDSGGFFVQQGKVTYDQLFPRLLNFYRRNDWGAAYVLPDYVPTSKNTVSEVDERVHVTAAEGVKFLGRMPRDLAHLAVGVLQGHTPAHLKHCYKAYCDAGVPHLGFGSFDTSGVNSEINLFTAQSERRLEVLRDLITGPYLTGKSNSLPSLHLFGVSSPALLATFPQFLATSFDSSGWMRTAGYGNVYLPFRSRRNVTHGASALSCGQGLTPAAYFAMCAETRHDCPFCRDFTRIQTDRYARMLHNAHVFREMTESLNTQTGNRLKAGLAGAGVG